MSEQSLASMVKTSNKAYVDTLDAIQKHLLTWNCEPILLTGDTGGGKTYLAEQIHKFLVKRGLLFGKAPFISINCAAIPESLQDSAMFGHTEGSFTDAVKYKEGFFEAANGGVLFLDELHHLSLGAQGKLLDVIESGKVTVVGKNNPIQVSFQLICATNEDLVEKIKNNEFREDLFFRICPGETGHKIPSLIESLSPGNKVEGKDFECEINNALSQINEKQKSRGIAKVTITIQEIVEIREKLMKNCNRIIQHAKVNEHYSDLETLEEHFKQVFTNIDKLKSYMENYGVKHKDSKGKIDFNLTSITVKEKAGKDKYPTITFSKDANPELDALKKLKEKISELYDSGLRFFKGNYRSLKYAIKNMAVSGDSKEDEENGVIYITAQAVCDWADHYKDGLEKAAATGAGVPPPREVPGTDRLETEIMKLWDTEGGLKKYLPKRVAYDYARKAWKEHVKEEWNKLENKKDFEHEQDKYEKKLIQDGEKEKFVQEFIRPAQEAGEWESYCEKKKKEFKEKLIRDAKNANLLKELYVVLDVFNRIHGTKEGKKPFDVSGMNTGQLKLEKIKVWYDRIRITKELGDEKCPLADLAVKWGNTTSRNSSSSAGNFFVSILGAGFYTEESWIAFRRAVKAHQNNAPLDFPRSQAESTGEGVATENREETSGNGEQPPLRQRLLDAIMEEDQIKDEDLKELAQCIKNNPEEVNGWFDDVDAGTFTSLLFSAVQVGTRGGETENEEQKRKEIDEQREKIVLLCLNNGAEAKDRDENGDSVLALAIQCSLSQTARALIDEGWDRLGLTDDEREEAARLAEKFRDQELAQKIRNRR